MFDVPKCPEWTINYLSAIDLGQLDDLVFQIKRTQLLFDFRVKDGYSTLDRFLVKKHRDLGDLFPNLVILIPRSHRRSYDWDVVDVAIEIHFPLTTSAGLFKMQYF